MPGIMKNAFHSTGPFFYSIVAMIVIICIHSCGTGKQLPGTKRDSDQPYVGEVIDRSGNHYVIKKFPDNKIWMVSNLELTIPGSYHYNDSAKYSEVYGRLYTWEAAQAGCLTLGQGWRLPTKEDWQQLGEHYGAIGRAETDIDKRAFYPMLAGGNSLFNAVLGGGRNPGGDYARLDAHGFYWTATQHDTANAWFANFAKGSKALYIQTGGEKVGGFSVRCVKSGPGIKK